MPTKLYYLAVDACIGKLYANSLLATLNYRKSLRELGFGKSQLASPFERSIFRTDFPSRHKVHNEDLELPAPINSFRATESHTNHSMSNSFSTDNRDPVARRDETHLGQGIVEISVSPINDGRPDPFSTRIGSRVEILSSG